MLADMGMKLEAARPAHIRCSRQVGAARRRPDILRCRCQAFRLRCCDGNHHHAVQLLGGYGYTKDFPVERMMWDAKITQIYEGTNQIQRIVVRSPATGWPVALTECLHFGATLALSCSG